MLKKKKSRKRCNLLWVKDQQKRAQQNILILFILYQIDTREIMGEDSGERLKCLIRITNLASGLIMIGFGIGGIIFMAIHSLLTGKFFLVFSPVFMVLFGIMIIGAEFAFNTVVGYFGFLQSLFGRGIFNIYLASSVFYYFACGDDSIVWLGWVMASIMFVVGVLYIILHFCGGSKAQQKKQTKQQMM